MTYTHEELARAARHHHLSSADHVTAMRQALDSFLPGYTQRIQAEAWDQAHDEFCPRRGACSTHGRSGDRAAIYARAAALPAQVEPRTEHLGGCNTESDHPCSCGAAPVEQS